MPATNDRGEPIKTTPPSVSETTATAPNPTGPTSTQCKECNGSGKVHLSNYIDQNGRKQRRQQDCPVCKGKGVGIAPAAK